MLEFDDETSALVDCGEGTQRQLLRADVALDRIDTILIAHEHVDHVFGLVGVLLLILKRYPLKQVTVYAPETTIGICQKTLMPFLAAEAARVRFIAPEESVVICPGRVICRTTGMYHTSSSLGYPFSCGSRSFAALGDIAIPHAAARDAMLRSVAGVDALVIEAVHVPVETVATLALEASVRRLFLVPVKVSTSADLVTPKARRHFPFSSVPADLESVYLE